MEVAKEDSFECAIRMIGLKLKPVVLDFASGTNPGGGWRGKQTGTQEESLCRRSDLGLLLEKKRYPIPNEGFHYIPVVTITKDIKLQTISPIKCAVIASELRAICERTPQYLQMRINSWYEVAILNKHDVIVLGAIGCGGFKESEDDAKLLADQMKICAEKHKDKIKTVYAIYNNKHNYKAFVEAMTSSD